jgi:hypothetical protein
MQWSKESGSRKSLNWVANAAHASAPRRLTIDGDHAKALIEIQYLTGLPERLPL